MDDSSSSELSFLWVWILEYLARHKQVPASLLCDMIKDAPHLPADLGRKAWELVASKGLEELCSFENEATAGSCELDSTAGFDSADTCVDVFQRMMHEVSIDELMTGREALPGDIRRFVQHKRAALPIPALRQLKDTIIDGTHPNASPLMIESGLQSHGAEPNGAAGHGGEYLVPANGPDRVGNQGTEENGTTNFPTLGNGGDILQGDSTVEGTLHGEELVCLHAESFVENLHENLQCHDDTAFLHPNDKKLVQSVPDALEPEKLALVVSNKGDGLNFLKDQIGSSVGGKAVEEGSGNIVEPGRISDGQWDRSPKMETNRDSSFHANDNAKRLSEGETTVRKLLSVERVLACPDANKVAQNLHEDQGSHDDISFDPNAEKLFPDALELGKSALADVKGRVDPERVVACVVNFSGSTENAMNGPSAGLPQHREVIMLGPEINMNHSAEEEQFSDSEEIKIALQKEEFLRSRMGNSAELNCVECNRGGELLVCRTIDCLMALHEECAVSSPVFDENGKFYCCFCTYANALKQLREHKKEAALGRKDVLAFLQTFPEADPETLCDMDEDLSEDDEHGSV